MWPLHRKKPLLNVYLFYDDPSPSVVSNDNPFSNSCSHSTLKLVLSNIRVIFKIINPKLFDKVE